MATLDYTGDAIAGAKAPNGMISMAKQVCFYRRLNVPDIIAADTTMTANGYIAADDIIQAIHIPIGFLFLKAAIMIVTSCTASVNVEVGLAGGAEAIASTDADGTAGTITTTIETDSWAGGKAFYAADTIDVQFITANCLVGCLDLYVIGHMLNIVAAPA